MSTLVQFVGSYKFQNKNVIYLYTHTSYVDLRYNLFTETFCLQVSLDSRVREVINRNLLDPNPHMYEDAQLQIYTLMHRDSFPRFLNSQVYKTFLDSMESSTTDS